MTMLDVQDPAGKEIAARAVKLGIGSNPDSPAHALGEVTLHDGRTLRAFVVHSADAIVMDGREVVMINRGAEPGKGKPALPGGLMDKTETAPETAAREGFEEVGLRLAAKKGIISGARNLDRPYDIRFAYDNGLEPVYGVREGDLFMVSTQGVLFALPDLSSIALKAGDDAESGSARRVAIASLTPHNIGIPDHYAMIMQALATMKK